MRTISESSTSEHILTLTILDKQTKSSVGGATIIVSNDIGRIVYKKTTTNTGVREIFLPAGDYVVTIQAKDYYKLIRGLHVDMDMEQIVELTPR
jgi:hypothetical protein